MNDIRPPRRPVPRKADEPDAPPPLGGEVSQPPADITDTSLKISPSPKRKLKKIVTVVLMGLFALIVATVVGGYVWYQSQLAPVSGDKNAEHTRLTIEAGSSPEMIAADLEEHDLIRNAWAFRLHTKLTGVENKLQAGVYNLSPASSTPEIVDTLTSGKVDTVTITFLPGATVKDNKEVLHKAGYSKDLVDAAFAKRYDHPVFKTKPAAADLEGYIYGETYQFPASATVEDILVRTFDELQKTIEENDLIAAYKKQDLTLFEGITLASIVQREVPGSADQKLVASVFFNRLGEGMNLGSDVTYQYIADKTGVPRDPSLDSPYNTRRYVGLPPGPIAAPGESALLAVARPATSDYLYFLSGDDDKTYFAKTDAEHERNKVDHCQKKCQIL